MTNTKDRIGKRKDRIRRRTEKGGAAVPSLFRSLSGAGAGFCVDLRGESG
ncbi:hypothetical protein HMPREF1986_00039 [Oribacterium sp. oral taxon 078 str. F0263]|nr:hypothetical protein HMPREF1986_00039 [Oribacterium sp. oral taxon 078 str. F0263]